MKRSIRCPKCSTTDIKHVGSKTDRLIWPGIALILTGYAATTNDFYKYLFIIVLLLAALSIRSVFITKDYRCNKCQHTWDKPKK